MATEQAVPADNVETARLVCEAAWRRPTPGYDTLNAHVHPDMEMFTVQSLVEGGGYVGAAGFREWLKSWGEMFGEDWKCSVEAAEALDENRVLVTAQGKFKGVGGGVPVEQRFWVLMTFRGEKVSRSEIHTDKDQAMEAAGLS